MRSLDLVPVDSGLGISPIPGAGLRCDDPHMPLTVLIVDDQALTKSEFSSAAVAALLEST